MESKIRVYVSRKNVLTWLMVLCMIGSAVARILICGGKGTATWSQIVLPVAAVLLYALIALFHGKEQFYKSAIPVWMICLYYFFVIRGVEFGSHDTLITALYAIALLAVAITYTQLTSEKARFVWILLIVLPIPLGAVGYLHRGLFSADVGGAFWGAVYRADLGNYRAFFADSLMTLGLLFAVLAIRRHPIGSYHPTWGDRSDGRRIRTEPPMNQVSPYIMITRNTSSNLFSEAFEITNVERYIRQKRREGLTSFGLTHVLLACYCRAIARYPKMNRFISGQKIFSRGEDLQFCMTIKKEMTSDSPETVIKVHLSPRDTAEDVYKKLNTQIEEVKNSPLDSNFDNTADALMMIPGIFLKFVVWLLRTLDYFGMLPKFLLEVSPFHGSVFFTSMGSLGIPPIYHHLYDFGNLPIFGSFGCKRRALELLEDGTLVSRKYLDCKFSMDERIADGYYYAAFFKHYKRILARPEILDLPVDEVVQDIE